jgi:general secretion pathway protein M
MSREQLANNFWLARSVRERVVLVGGLGFVIVLLGYMLLWRPMLQDIARLQEQLPRLRAEAAQIGRAGDEIARLRGKAPPGALNPAQLLPLMERSASNHGLQGNISKANQGSSRIGASFGRVAFSAWISWVDELHRNHRIVLVSSKLSALDAPGIVRAEAEFAPAATLQ